MKFDLTEEVVNQIIFGMENQEVHHLFDSRDLRLLRDDEVLAETNLLPETLDEPPDSEGVWLDSRFLQLPEWRSVDGYNLMEGFVASLRNPIYREILRQILQGGKGVFRQFKDALKERKDIERLWFRFKEKEMRHRVLEWYNELRELWGMAPLDLEPETTTDDLILADFSFSLAEPGLSKQIIEWDQESFALMFPYLDGEELELLWQLKRQGLPGPAQEDSVPVLLALTPTGEIAGFLWALEMGASTSANKLATIVQLTVVPDFRGLGLGMALVRSYRQLAAERGVSRIVVDVPAGANFMAHSLEREGYQVLNSSYQLGIGDH